MEPQVVITLPPDASADLIARLAAAFPEAKLVEPAAEVSPYQAEAVEAALAGAVADAPRLGGMLETWWAGLPLGGWGVFAVMLGVIIGAWFVEQAAARLVRFERGAEPPPLLSERAPRGFMWLLWHLLLLAAFAVMSSVAFRVIVRPDAELAGYFQNVLQMVVRARFMLFMIGMIVAPDSPARRLLNIPPAGGARIMHALGWLVLVMVGAGVLKITVEQVGGLGSVTVLPRILLTLVSGVAGLVFFVSVREPIRDRLLATLGPARVAAGGPLTVLARHWHWIYVALLALDALVKSAGILGLLGDNALRGSGQAVFLLVLAPLGVAALRVWGAESAARAAAEGRQKGGVFFGLMALAEGAFQLGVVILLLRAWGVDPANPPTTGVGQFVPRLVEAAGMIVLGFAIWQAVGAFLTPREDRPDEQLDEEQRRSRRRLATILPVLRGVALAVVGVLTAMTALSALGVNIAPLLASAGVLGLAIGFGAQRLVADVISGVLYLYEDAFRIGEYIEVSGGKGTVERISLRSVRLRHPRGPVYTIPFSGMGTVQNHSRDFATMKFNFAVPAGTDLEKVRKLVKKAGEKMLEDPEMKAAIIEPMKSQGAIGIQGASYQIGVKFTAKPGQQFAVRRRAFIAVSQALEENGIKLFAPQLTINPANPASPLMPAGGEPSAVG